MFHVEHLHALSCHRNVPRGTFHAACFCKCSTWNTFDRDVPFFSDWSSWNNGQNGSRMPHAFDRMPFLFHVEQSGRDGARFFLRMFLVEHRSPNAECL